MTEPTSVETAEANQRMATALARYAQRRSASLIPIDEARRLIRAAYGAHTAKFPPEINRDLKAEILDTLPSYIDELAPIIEQVLGLPFEDLNLHWSVFTPGEFREVAFESIDATLEIASEQGMVRTEMVNALIADAWTGDEYTLMCAGIDGDPQAWEPDSTYNPWHIQIVADDELRNDIASLRSTKRMPAALAGKLFHELGHVTAYLQLVNAGNDEANLPSEIGPERYRRAVAVATGTERARLRRLDEGSATVVECLSLHAAAQTGFVDALDAREAIRERVSYWIGARKTPVPKEKAGHTPYAGGVTDLRQAFRYKGPLERKLALAATVWRNYDLLQPGDQESPEDWGEAVEQLAVENPNLVPAAVRHHVTPRLPTPPSPSGSRPRGMRLT